MARRRQGRKCEVRGRNLSLTAQLVILVVPGHIELQIRHRAVAYEDRPAWSIHRHSSLSMIATCETLLGTAGCGMLQTVPFWTCKNKNVFLDILLPNQKHDLVRDSLRHSSIFFFLNFSFFLVFSIGHFVAHACMSHWHLASVSQPPSKRQHTGGGATYSIKRIPDSGARRCILMSRGCQFRVSANVNLKHAMNCSSSRAPTKLSAPSLIRYPRHWLLSSGGTPWKLRIDRKRQTANGKRYWNYYRIRLDQALEGWQKIIKLRKKLETHRNFFCQEERTAPKARYQSDWLSGCIATCWRNHVRNDVSKPKQGSKASSPGGAMQVQIEICTTAKVAHVARAANFGWSWKGCSLWSRTNEEHRENYIRCIVMRLHYFFSPYGSWKNP